MSTPQKVMSGTAGSEDVLQCMFGLSRLDITILKALIKDPEQRTSDIANAIGKDRSVAHRSLQRLAAANFVVKEKHDLEQGGYYHTYSALPVEVIRFKMKTCADEFYDCMQKVIEDFDLSG